MGNSLCRPYADCFNQCFRKNYDRISSVVEFHPFVSATQRVPKQSDNGRLNRITEYVAWALNRSRSPLLLDDALSITPVDSNPPDLTGPNTVSWMSDAASSDGSHLLYRELDPYNQASFVRVDARTPPSSSQFDSSDAPKEGGWVAVTRLSDNRHGTSTSAVYLPNTAVYDLAQQSSNPNQADDFPSACDEELDGPELARLARSLWPRSTKGKKHRIETPTAQQPPNSSVPHCVVEASTAVGSCTPYRDCIPATRPTQLNLRTSLSDVPPDQVKLESNVMNVESPIELDWDHEPGTISPREPRKVPARRQHLTLAPTMKAAKGSGFQPADFNTDSDYRCNELNPFSIRHRRRVPGSRRDVAILPLTGNTTQLQAAYIRSIGDPVVQSTQSKRVTSLWTESNTSIHAPPISGNPIAAVTDMPHSNLLVSSSPYLQDTLLSGNPQEPPCHELVDSGFAGLSGSYGDYESDGGACRLADFLWEHELLESPHSRRLTSTPYS